MRQVFYSSKTGNTKYLAEILAASWQVKAEEIGQAEAKAEMVAVGFWTDRGFGGSEAYFANILERTMALLPPSATVVGTFCCQGKMDAAVKRRYEQLLKEKPGDETVLQMMKNYEAALPHPNVADGAGLLLAASQLEA